MRRRALRVGLSLATVAGFIGSGGVITPSHAASTSLSVRVVGNHLVDGKGQLIQLDGFTHSGSEYACDQGWGIFEGPVDNAAIRVMQTWHPHVVRIPLNEDCWLDINGVKPQYGGANYVNAIKAYVGRLNAHGIYADLQLMNNAPGTTLPDEPDPMPDADHSPAFWASVARTFASNHAVIFDLFNEPRNVSWSCWRDGCMTDGYQAVGMQQLVDAIRGTGAKNVILAPGLDWSNDVSGWLSHEPNDPAHQVGAAVHVYDSDTCVTVTCWNGQYAKVARHVPLVATEFGDGVCNGVFVDKFMHWSDAHDVSYLAWTWNTWNCKTGPSLIKDYNGTPNGQGRDIRAHFIARFPQP